MASLAPGQMYVAEKPARSAARRDFVKAKPCLVCEAAPPSEAAHIGPHGMSQKASDFQTVPLCGRCHREAPDSNSKLGRNWAAHHRIDIDRVIKELNEEYLCQKP